MDKLADTEHPVVQKKVAELSSDTDNPREILQRIFRYVRDDIVFAFPPEGDFVKASQTIVRGYGQCNTKGILFLTLCRASGIPARIHFSKIKKDIQRGFFTGVAYWLVPNELTHSWVEVKIDGQWYPVDTYINDLKLHNAAVRELCKRDWLNGFSVSRQNGTPSAELNFDKDHFSQMAAVTGDDGVWNDPAEFLNSGKYLNQVGPVRKWMYRLMLPIVNARVRRLREQL